MVGIIWGLEHLLKRYWIISEKGLDIKSQVEYKGGHLDNEGEKTMRRRSKTKGRMRAMRGPDGRFSKAVSKSLEKGQVAETGINRLKAVAEGTCRQAAIECYELSVERVYYHPKLVYGVKVRQYDQFTNDLLRQF
jgi:hypothetical protein